MVEVTLGGTGSTEFGVNLVSRDEDNYAECGGDNREDVATGDGGNGIENTKWLTRTRPRPFWRIVLMLMLVFVAMVVAAAVNCAVDSDCGVMQTPSIGALLNDSDTSVLTSSGLTVLMGVHATATLSTSHLVRRSSMCAPASMLIVALLLYASVFVAIVLRIWYAAIVPVVLSVVWMGCVMEGLRKFYRKRPRRRLYKISTVFIVGYSLASALYIVFNSVPNLDFPGKDHAVFAVEMAMLVTGAVFVCLLIPHGRGITYMIQIKK